MPDRWGSRVTIILYNRDIQKSINDWLPLTGPDEGGKIALVARTSLASSPASVYVGEATEPQTTSSKRKSSESIEIEHGTLLASSK